MAVTETLQQRATHSEPLSHREPGAGLGATRAPLSRAHHLPGYLYTSPEVWRLEKERIFMKDWLCVARVEEVETPGDFMTFDVMGDPIVVTRDEDGTLNAFSNLCRHRGVEVAQGSGNTKEFSCPYHGWLYDLNGRLTGAPFMKDTEGFDPKSCRLRPLRVDVWAGWVFVNFDAEAGPLADFVAPFENGMGFLHQEELRMADKLVFELACNWKLVIENSMDFYHVSAVHADTFGTVTITDYHALLEERGGFSVEYRAKPHTYDGKLVFGKMPAIADKPEDFAMSGYLAPNMHLFARIENMRPVVNWPLAIGRTKLIYYILFPKQWFERPDFADGVKKYHDFYSQVVVEDAPMMEALQRAMSSKRFEPGPMSIQEEVIHNGIIHRLDQTFGAT